ncbi:MAG: hypothetical protein CBD66_001500 [Flavobacteriaceae bacterium TMED206]|nr:MAG: hypothetical protein CBD66_001500 [Flavobacteriaceae bacterium TMED206]
MNKTKLLLNLSVFCFLITSCENFSTKTYTPQQIKKASQWSDKDQMPTFETCSSLEIKEQFDCFKDEIANSIYNSLSYEDLISNQEIDEEIILNIIVDNEGNIALDNVENGSIVYDAIPTLSEMINLTISSLPKALPATKTNVGIYVKSKIKLPIRITASP